MLSKFASRNLPGSLWADGIDVFDVKDVDGNVYEILHGVCYGTTFGQGWIVRTGTSRGIPSSQNCLKAFTRGWTRWAGWPRFIACDRGLHNRGAFSIMCGKKGIRIRPAGLESPEQIGRVERRGDVLKKMMQKVIKETNASGTEAVDMILSESLNAVNELARHGGFAPVQWVLNKFPRSPATQGDEDEFADIGAIQGHLDGPTAFALQAKYREECRK